jgi:molecular chaperone GrpE
MAKEENTDDVIEVEQAIGELTQDLQRTRADFENYRKRVEAEKSAAREAGQAASILKLLPVIDTIERAVTHMPDDLKENKWAQGIAGVSKNLAKTLEGLNLQRIDATVGQDFNPELHEAIQFEEEATGDKEVVAEELQAGYLLHGKPIRHAMVKVTRQ